MSEDSVVWNGYLLVPSGTLLRKGIYRFLFISDFLKWNRYNLGPVDLEMISSCIFSFQPANLLRKNLEFHTAAVSGFPL